jgi:MtN3 and saliva related transmembrane protein
MSPDLISALGAAAAFCTTAAYLPQLIRAWRTRSTRDMSLPWIVLLVTGVALWLVYGVLIGDGPLIAANGVTFCFTASILYLKLRHG